MRIIAAAALALVLTPNSATAAALKTCSQNKAYCDNAAKAHGWTQPQCADAYAACMSTGEWHTGGAYGRTVRNVERR